METILFLLFTLITAQTYSQTLNTTQFYIDIKEPFQDIATNDYLRFYEEGQQVVAAVTTGTPYHVKNWLTPAHQYMAKGTFKLKKNKLSFTVTNQNGDIKYTGKILQDGLLAFNIESLITGHISYKKFRVVTSEELEKAPPKINQSPKGIATYEAAVLKPEFVGGEQKMLEYISNNLNYPSQSLTNKIEGQIYVRFVVEKNGSCTHVEILRGLDEPCNTAIKTLIENMPKWKAGKDEEGEKIRCYYVLPVKFALPK